MAGSRKWVVYQDDSSNDYSVQIDEGNAELAGFTDVSFAMEIAGVVPPPLPKGMTMRYVNVKDNNSGSTRKIWVGNKLHGLVTGSIVSLLLWAFTDGGAVAAVSWAVTSPIGEAKSSKRPNAVDTGFLDGDAT